MITFVIDSTLLLTTARVWGEIEQFERVKSPLKFVKVIIDSKVAGFMKHYVY